MAKLLTVRKQAWVGRFRPDVVRGTPLSPNAAVEARYYANLSRLIDTMAAQTESVLVRLFHGDVAVEFFAEDMAIAQDASITDKAKKVLSALQKKFDKLFEDAAESMADSMANQSEKASSTALHSSIKQLSGGLSLPTTTLKGPLTDILKATIQENVALIKSIPQQYLNGVQGAVMRSITTGNGLKDLVPYLARNKGITERRARFIAMDQTRKAFNNLSKGRCLIIGLDKGEWLHTGGSNHPRPTHIAMTGKIFNLREGLYDSDVGRKVFTGELPGCRCRFLPVMEFKT